MEETPPTPVVEIDEQAAPPDPAPSTTEGSKSEKAPVEEIDPEELAQAKNLYKVLKDPRTAKAAIKMLADEHGLIPTQKDTPKQEERKIKSIKSIVKEKLGDEYAFLSDKLGDVFEEALGTERERYEARLSEVSTKSALQEAEAAFDKLAKNYDDFSQYEDAISGLMDRIPNKDMSAYEYLETLYDIAKSRDVRGKGSRKLAEKIQRNSTDPAVRLAGKTTAREVKTPARVMSIDDALAEAVSQFDSKSA
jgi:antirestriction protein